MSYRSGWNSKSPGPNRQGDSYECGYGGGRTDLPTVGYNPTYPVLAEQSHGPSTHGYGYQTSSNTMFSSPYASQDYTTTYSSYTPQHFQEQRDPTPSSIITVDKSRYSVKNTLSKNFICASNLESTSNPPVPLTFSSNSQTESVSGSTADINPSNSDNNVQASKIGDSKQANSIMYKQKRTFPRGKIGKRRPDPYYRAPATFGAAPWDRSAPFGHAPWHAPPQAFISQPLEAPNFVRPRYPKNNRNDIEFEVIPEGCDTLSFKIDTDNLECFSGLNNIFTIQHVGPVLIDDNIYESVDHYYQFRKVIDLCGSASEKITNCIRDRKGVREDKKSIFNEKRGQSFSNIAKEQLRLNHIFHDAVEEWRRTKGLAAIQKGLFSKLSQDHDFRLALLKTGEKILVHSYPGDAIFGTGSNHLQVNKWCANMKKSGNVKLIIPATSPLTEMTVKHCPYFSFGRNILGVILMQLREKLINGNINTTNLSILFKPIKEGKSVENALLEDVNITGSSFLIGDDNNPLMEP